MITSVDKSMPDCNICKNVRYLVSTRLNDNGKDREAVERCDNCAVDYLNDEQAAVRARRDGIKCEVQYPCYIIKE